MMSVADAGATPSLIIDAALCCAGIVPYINASIILQLLSQTYPELKKLQREEGNAGKEKYEMYQKYCELPLCSVALSIPLPRPPSNPHTHTHTHTRGTAIDGQSVMRMRGDEGGWGVGGHGSCLFWRWV